MKDFLQISKERYTTKHYDATKKKYIVSKADSAHAGYEAALNKFEVVDVATDFGYNLGVETIRLEAR